MELSLFKSTAYSMLRNLGWILAVAGLIMPAMQVYDEISATPARATVAEIGHVCEKGVCLIGRCTWQRVECTAMKKLSAAGETVRRNPRAKVEFTTTNGTGSAWASFSKLNLESAKVGDKLDLRYRGPAPYYVAPPFSYLHAGIGLMFSLLGVLILIVSGARREGDEADNTAGSN